MRVIPQLDADPRLVALVQTPVGKIGAIVAFALLLKLNGESLFVEMAAVVAILSFLPKYRLPLLSAISVCWLLSHPNWIPMEVTYKAAAAEGIPQGWTFGLAAVAAICLVFCAQGLLLHVIRTRPRNFAGRRPVLLTVGSFLLLMMAAGTLPLHGWTRVAVWMLLALAAPYLWFFAYSFGDAAGKNPDPYRLQFGTFFPFWLGSVRSPTPIGKGAAYLRKVEARTSKDLAVIQLKALKLLMWVFVLQMLLQVFRAVVFGHMSATAAEFCRVRGFHVFNFGVPALEAILNRGAGGYTEPAHVLWASVAAHFTESILEVPMMGNMVVACIRMAGFNVLRNTYKPLYAATIAEFWNRFYFYFKELLVEFFFIPAYLRYFKHHRRLRLMAATFAAATVGNMVYHFCRDINYVFELGFWRAVSGFQVYAFYALILGSAIAFSQLRGKRAPGPRPFYRRLISSAGVIGFYALLEIFDYEGRSHSLKTHLAFLASLFPLGR